MEDKKVMAFIQANHEIEYEKFVKYQKRKKKIEKVKDIVYSILIVIILGVFIVLDSNYTKQGIKACVKNGYSYNYCLRES